MADIVNIGCFLEDIGQERFITALILRIVADIGQSPEACRFDVRNAEGGSGRAVTEYERFLKDCAKGNDASFDILVVAIDGNCKGTTEVTNGLRESTERSGYSGCAVYAVPDPHIEKWYMADTTACQAAIGTPQQPACPSYKCVKDRYKKALIDAIVSSGVIPLQGGTEYAPDIAERMDLYNAGKNDSSLGRFIDDMRRALRGFLS